MDVKKIMKMWFLIILIVLGVAILFFLGIYCFFWFFPSIGAIPNKKMRKSYQEKTLHFYDNQFHNVEDFTLPCGKYEKNKGAIAVPKREVPVITWESYPKSNPDDFTINWLGHSSCLIQMNGCNILIDPVLSKYASPVSFIGSKRFSKVPMEPENLPQIQVLLISHDHFDHLDYSAIMKIDEKVEHYLVPLGVESYFLSWGISKEKIHPLIWWEQFTFRGITFTMTPSQHFSGRNPFYKNISFWGGYHFTNQKHSIYFTGDSGYNDHFKEVYRRLGSVRVMLADAGQYNTKWSKIHMRPLEVLEASQDVHATYLIPVHWGAFALSNHEWNEPPKVIKSRASEYGVTVITPKIGERVVYDAIRNYQDSWWNFK